MNMNAGQRTTRRLAAKAAPSICRSCRDSISRNTYATAAAAAQTEDQNTSSIQHIPPVHAASSATSYAVNAGVVLSRPPLITRDLHPFESAFFLYQRRLNERLALPFTRYFYFKKKTPADIEWKRKIKQRLTPARDIGRYKGYGDEAWNDELLVGAQESEIQHQVERLLEDAEHPVIGGSGEEGTEVEANAEGSTKAATVVPEGSAKKLVDDVIERPMPRVTEADLKNDVKSLNRMLQRTLYLLVKDQEGRWIFPQGRLIKKESLHMAAERVLVQSGGINMNTWVVGNVPVGHYEYNFRPELLKSSPNPNEVGFKTFFMKARILAGQANLAENKFGLMDFKWLAKEEVEKEVQKSYWHSVKNMLAER
ncbi:39S mitochondrial ribosomal protein L46-domain-containing protein [Clohesyomyces aquaticus]|uniref:Large ribosomal subunit protein mL46 n=1 Tax=Clohesyomyces aquaticus TaxID=1231657 RepID=A0A1Y1YEP7_9PLEO|nr:39S mitochondrial ribosomal protein L46-domain-containing protein [Clohesyomyces aquaticus]